MLLDVLYIAEKYHWPFENIMAMDMKDFVRVLNITHGKDKAIKYVRSNPKIFGG